MPIAVTWVWLSWVFEFPSAVLLTVLLAWLLVVIFFACLMVEAFEADSWMMVFIEVLGVIYWISALVKLIRVVRGRAAFPELTP